MKEKISNRIIGAFDENSQFKVFLLSLLITGLSYGLYKGMLDNFLVEVVGMGEMDRGVAEFFREICCQQKGYIKQVRSLC